MRTVRTKLWRIGIVVLVAAVLLMTSVATWGWPGFAEAGSPVKGNDDFADAIVIPEPLPYSNEQNTEGATLEAGEPQSCSTFGKTVWYSFTPTSNAQLAAHTRGSNFNTVLAVYTGNTLASLVSVACDDNSGAGLGAHLVFAATAGETYYFQVGGFAGSGADLVLNLDEAIIKGNDDFADAVQIPGPLPYSNKQDTTGATAEVGEPIPPLGEGCSTIIDTTVWYTYTPATDQFVAADSMDSGYPAQIIVWEGTSFDNLVFIGCAGNNETVEFAADAGTTYYFQVDGFGTAIGNLEFDLAVAPTPTATPTPCPSGKVPANGGCGTPAPTLTPTPCPAVCPEMRLTVKEGDCDDPVRPTTCDVTAGDQFTLSVDAVAPPEGYVAMQTWLQFNSDLSYQYTLAETDEIVWPDCEPEAAVRAIQFSSDPQTVLHYCVANLSSHFTGQIVELTFNCSPSESSTSVDPYPPGNFFTLPDGDTTIVPKLGSLTINCVEPAAVGGVSRDVEAGALPVASEGPADGRTTWLWVLAGLATFGSLAVAGWLARARLTR